MHKLLTTQSFLCGSLFLFIVACCLFGDLYLNDNYWTDLSDHLQTRKKVDSGVGESIVTDTDSLAPQSRSPQSQFSEFEEKASVAKLFEQGIIITNFPFITYALQNNVPFNLFKTKFWVFTVGLQKILSLLEAEDGDVRIHAVKVVANLAAEGMHFLFRLYNSFDLENISKETDFVEHHNLAS